MYGLTNQGSLVTEQWYLFAKALLPMLLFTFLELPPLRCDIALSDVSLPKRMATRMAILSSRSVLLVSPITNSVNLAEQLCVCEMNFTTENHLLSSEPGAMVQYNLFGFMGEEDLHFFND